ncbi:MAG: DDE-type integrase/transposase/recombinase, partial [Thermoanaerobaculia bacterium]
MKAKTSSYHGYRFPSEIISHAVWLYYRFCLIFRDVEDLLAKRGVIDILVQSRRDRRAAKRFFRKLLKGQGGEPRRLVTDKLRSYGAAHRTVMPSVLHDTSRYANNRAEVSH